MSSKTLNAVLVTICSVVIANLIVDLIIVKEVKE